MKDYCHLYEKKEQQFPKIPEEVNDIQSLQKALQFIVNVTDYIVIELQEIGDYSQLETMLHPLKEGNYEDTTNTIVNLGNRVETISNLIWPYLNQGGKVLLQNKKFTFKPENSTNQVNQNTEYAEVAVRYYLGMQPIQSICEVYVKIVNIYNQTLSVLNSALDIDITFANEPNFRFRF